MTDLPAWALTTVAAARTEVHAASTDHDEKLEQLVRAASARINALCGYKLKSTVYAKVGAVDARMRLDGNGTPRIRVEAFPVTALAACVYIDAAGDEQDIDITGATIDREAGLVTLTADVFPSTTVLMSCTAGLTADDAGLAVVEHACLRLIAAWYDRWKNALGITASASEGGVTTTFMQEEMPQEVVDMLRPFVWVGWV